MCSLYSCVFLTHYVHIYKYALLKTSRLYTLPIKYQSLCVDIVKHRISRGTERVAARASIPRRLKCTRVSVRQKYAQSQ